MPTITTRSERTDHWVRMRRSFDRFSQPETSNHTLFLVDFITITYVPRFSVHTAAPAAAWYGYHHRYYHHHAYYPYHHRHYYAYYPYYHHHYLHHYWHHWY